MTDPQPYQQVGGRVSDDARDEKEIRTRSRSGDERMVKIIPRGDGDWLRREFRLDSDDEWQYVGSEVIEHLHVDGFDSSGD